MVSTTNRSFETAVITTSGIDLDISNKFDLNRYTGDVLVLPYTFNEVRIKSNDLCVADNVNASLAKLHHNFLYLNAQTKLADNNFPKNYKGFISSTSASTCSGVGWYPPISGSDDIVWQLGEAKTGTPFASMLSGVVAGDFTRQTHSVNTYVGVVALSSALSTTLLAIESHCDDSCAHVAFNVSTVEDASGLSFTDIKSIKFTSDHRVIVLDDSLIHKLDVDPILTANRALSSAGRFLVNTIGGKSRDIYDKDKFNNPVDLYVGNNDDIYVLDQDDYGIKKYDKDLNWLKTSARKSQYTALSGGKVVSIAVDKHTDYVYVLSNNGIVFEYDSDLTFLQRIWLSDPIDADEEYKQLIFSNKETDILYVMTNRALYKKFKTKLSTSIGAFRLTDNNISENESFAFLSLMTTTKKSYDHVFIGSNNESHATINGPLSKLYKFDESIDYKTLTTDTYKSDLISLSSIKVKGFEYVTDLTINKAISKLLFNHLIFRDSFLTKYVAAYDSRGRLRLTNIEYLKATDYNLFSYEVTKDHYVGINEPVFAETINRSFRKMYDLQNNLLTMCAEKVTNKFPYATQVIELK